MARKLVVEIVGDSRSLERAFRRSEKAATGFSGKLTGTFTKANRAFSGFAAIVAGGTLVAALKTTVTAASDLNEELSKSEQIFGSSASTIEAWSKTASEALKLSQTEALRFAGAIGAMLKTAGIAGPRLAAMSKRLVQLGADMASFNNQDPTEMLQRLQSGLAGEAEPLRRFGVLLSEARVQQEAYRIGLAKTGAKLTEQQKVLARYSLILGDTATQQGDVRRTGDQLAGQQRELTARLRDLQATLGTALLPIVRRWLERLNTWLQRMKESGELQRKFNRLIDSLSRNLPKIAHGIERVAEAVGKVRDAFGGWDNAIKTLGLLVLLARLRRVQGRSGGKGGQGGSGLLGIAASLTGWPGIATVAAAGFVNASEKMSGAVNAVYEASARFNSWWLRHIGVDIPTGLEKASNATLKLASAFDVVAASIAGVSAAWATIAPGLTHPPKPMPGRATAAGGGIDIPETTLPFRIRLAQTRAEMTATVRDNVAAAKQVVAFIQPVVASLQQLATSGQLHGKRLSLARKRLLDALEILGDAQKTIADATRDATRKQADAAKKHAAAMKAAAERLQQRIAEMRDRMGRLFEGPLLAPTEAQRRAQLGFPSGQLNLALRTADVRAQTRQFQAFQNALANLTRRGAPQSLLAELRQRGPGDPLAQQLAQTRPGALRGLFAAIRQQERVLKRAAERPLRVFVTVNLDGKTVAANVTAHQQRAAGRQGKQRRGPQGGAGGLKTA